jgi:hypothetical protein
VREADLLSLCPGLLPRPLKWLILLLVPFFLHRNRFSGLGGTTPSSAMGAGAQAFLPNLSSPGWDTGTLMTTRVITVMDRQVRILHANLHACMHGCQQMHREPHWGPSL